MKVVAWQGLAEPREVILEGLGLNGRLPRAWIWRTWTLMDCPPPSPAFSSTPSACFLYSVQPQVARPTPLSLANSYSSLKAQLQYPFSSRRHF